MQSRGINNRLQMGIIMMRMDRTEIMGTMMTRATAVRGMVMMAKVTRTLAIRIVASKAKEGEAAERVNPEYTTTL